VKTTSRDSPAKGDRLGRPLTGGGNALRGRFAGALLLVALGGCGGGGQATAVGRSGSGERGQAPVDLTLRMTDGGILATSDLRGAPTLLFLFATFDGASQAALRPIRRFVADHPDVQIVGVAVQPQAPRLADAWVVALDPPFPVGWEPEETILEGTSVLGAVEAVPTLVMLDAAGVEVDRHVGFPPERRLGELARAAGVTERPPEREAD